MPNLNEGKDPRDPSEDLKSPENAWMQNVRSIGFVERYFDAGLEIPRNLSVDFIAERQTIRIVRALTVIIIAGATYRRLGDEASDEELTLDKKRAKRVGWALTQAHGGWSKKDPKIQITPELERDGTQLEYHYFIPEHMTQIMIELRLVATWAIRNKEERWGRSAVVNLENEMRWIQYAMRD
jgi:hypothetical protein